MFKMKWTESSAPDPVLLETLVQLYEFTASAINSPNPAIRIYFDPLESYCYRSVTRLDKTDWYITVDQVK